MRTEYFAALLAFAFVAVWAEVGFGSALLALIVAGAAYLVARFTRGDLDVGDVRERVEGARAGFSRPRVDTTAATTRPPTRTR